MAILKIKNGQGQVVEIESLKGSGIPSVTASDNGKILKVVNGVWAAAEGGGDDLTQYMTFDSNIFQNATVMPDTVVFNGTHLNTLPRFQDINANVSLFDITIPDGKQWNLQNLFVRSKVKKVKIRTAGGSDVLNASSTSETHTYDAFRSQYIEELDFSLSLPVTSNDMFTQASALKEVRFVSNGIGGNIRFHASPLLSDDSLVSIANGLNSSATSKTLTLHATPYAKCSTIMGTVADGVFTKSGSGNVSLATFISSTKGWTLASA